MQIIDLINGFNELIGGFFLWNNCRLLFKSKEIKGVSVTTTAFFTYWGYYNLFYYSALNQPFSFLGAINIVAPNTIWVVMALYYKYLYKGNKNVY